ncbi:helicase-related protein [Pseudoxanthomonas mexicana]
MDYRQSLAQLMGQGDLAEIEAIALRQERTVDALLQRMYDPGDVDRRELVLLADEVGLGKTFVALGVAWSVLRGRIKDGLPSKPILIVTPTSKALFEKWQRDAETFLKVAVRGGGVIAPPAVETPHDLAKALCDPRADIVIARMSAFEGQLHRYEVAMAATLHALFSDGKWSLDVDQRLRLVEGLSFMQSRDDVYLHRSGHFWTAAEAEEKVGFGRRHVKRAMRRLQRVAPWLMDDLNTDIERVRTGGRPRSHFLALVRELARAALGQRVSGTLPLVIVDEIHNWKNHPKSWERFHNMLGGRIDRMLGLSATPFQLGPDELIRVLDVRKCLRLDDDRQRSLDQAVELLGTRLAQAQQAGSQLAGAWNEVRAADVSDVEQAWSTRSTGLPAGTPSRIDQALRAALGVESAHHNLKASLHPFLIRHRRDTRHRRWRVGCDAGAPLHDASRDARTLAWRPGLDVQGDGELVHYLMMRATQESKRGKGATSLGSDLGGSYEFFRQHELRRLKEQGVASARPYLDLVDKATGPSTGQVHPKVRVTVERAFNAWLHGEKTLVFCFNPLTVDALRDAVSERIRRHEQAVLMGAFGCGPDDYPKRLENFQKRLYNYRRSLFLLFQDHPLAGPGGRVPRDLALGEDDLAQIARVLAAAGSPRDGSRFDRRRVLAAIEHVLVARWRQTARGSAWLEEVLPVIPEGPGLLIEEILSPAWPSLRRSRFEGVQKDAEAEPFPDDDDHGTASEVIDPLHEAAWRDVLAGRAGRAVLAPYLAQGGDVPSLLLRWHAAELHGLPARHRTLATRMLRRMARSPGFLARFLFKDVATGSVHDEDDDDPDGQWAARLHDRWCAPPAGGESARDRFNAYLETLRKVVGHDTGTRAYEDAARNRDAVARVTGGVANVDRDRFFTGFNTPLVPEVLILTSVGQEGIDLHRECRHVIHHDLPWNPATLEQRTGRVDRIGSKAERLAGKGEEAGVLDVVVPYVANTYDEYRFRRVHARAHLFEVTMGANYAVETAGHAGNTSEDNPVVDDANVDDTTEAVVPLPEVIARALRMRLEAEGNGNDPEQTTT